MKIPTIAINTKTFLKISKKSQYNSDYYQTHKEQYLKSQKEWLSNIHSLPNWKILYPNLAKNRHPENREKVRYWIKTIQKLFQQKGFASFELKNPADEREKHEILIKQVEKNQNGWWSDYYTCQKPYCYLCEKKAIEKNEYRFCSDGGIQGIKKFVWICSVKQFTQNPLAKLYYIVGKKILPSFIIYINSRCFFFVSQKFSLTKKHFGLAWQMRKNRSQLEEMINQLGGKPLAFKKKIQELEWENEVVELHWNKEDIIKTINQVPQEENWQSDIYWAKKDLFYYLLKYNEAGVKNRLVDDFDWWKKDKNGNYLFDEKTRKYLDQKVWCIINYFKIPWYEISKSGSPKIHWNLLGILPSKCKFWHNKKILGDRLGKGCQSTAPNSLKNRIVFTKWFYKNKNLRLPLVSLKEIDDFYQNKLSIFSGNPAKKLVKKEKTLALPRVKSKSSSQSLKYGKLVKKTFKKISSPVMVEKLCQRGGSRPSEYYQLEAIDWNNCKIRLLVDKGWRKKVYQKLVANIRQGRYPPLQYREGTYTNFITRIYE